MLEVVLAEQLAVVANVRRFLRTIQDLTLELKTVTAGKIAVKTKLPATPINAPRKYGFDIPAANLKIKTAGIAAARLACPEIIGGKLETISVIFGTKIGLRILALSTAIIASFLKMFETVLGTLVGSINF